MLTIHIGGATRRWATKAAVEESWIAQTLTGHQRDGEQPCVRFQLSGEDVSLSFATARCGMGGGGSREFSAKEVRAIELWRQNLGDKTDVTPGEVIAFAKQCLGLLS